MGNPASMAFMMRVALAVAALGSSSAAVAPRLRHMATKQAALAAGPSPVAPVTAGPPARVCISLSAYEEPEWIDAVLTNAKTFTEPTTMIMLHLNSKEEYSQQQLKTWNETERVIVNYERVAPQRFHGSILYSHLLNVKNMPSTCEYVMLQASNMLWMRHGMEKAVRDQHIGGVNNVVCNCPGECMCKKRMLHDFFRNYLMEMSGPVDMSAPGMGWGYHEGSFYPVSLVKDFHSYMFHYLEETQKTVEATVLNAMDDAEEYWLQTYVLNKVPWKEEFAPALALFDTTETGVTLDEVKAIQKGEMPPPPFWNQRMFGKHGFYAAKRVMRDLNHPVTSYIMSLP